MDKSDVNSFLSAFYDNQNLFSEKLISEPDSSGSGDTPALNKSSMEGLGGRIVRSLSSKFARLRASDQVRNALTGGNRICNSNVLNHLKNSLENSDSIDELKQTELKTVLSALKTFGANPDKIAEIEKIIQDSAALTAESRTISQQTTNRMHGDSKGSKVAMEKKLNKAALKRFAANSDKIPERNSIILDSAASAPESRIIEQNKTGETPKNSKDSKVAMEKNLYKAASEHIESARGSHGLGDAEAYINPNELSSIQRSPQEPGSLKFSHVMASEQGRRSSNEDAEFYKKINVQGNEGILSGIFDGHGGSIVSNYVNKHFVSVFSEQLRKNLDVRVAFQQTFDQLQADIKQKGFMDGSTAVVSYVDTKSNLVYTATLGDSEANVYRKIDGQWKSIPLSPVRDWTSDKDAARASGRLYLQKDKIMTEIQAEEAKAQNAKFLRFRSPKGNATNVSRSLGDVNFYGDGKGVIQKSKITVFKLEPGDRLILACDGLKDHVPETAIVAQLDREDGTDLAQTLANLAINTYESKDNVSVVAISVS